MAEILNVTEKEYRALPGINSTMLQAFSESPDHALLERRAKQVFTNGTAFEDIVWWKVYDDRSKLDARFFVADLGTPPDKIIQAIESGTDLSSLEVLTAKGERNGRNATLHAWIDACQENPGRKPLSQDEFNTLNRMADNLIGMDLDGPCGDIIAACEWQVPIVWERRGIKKKSLIDLVLHVGDETYIYDLKAYASLSMFRQTLKNKAWIQAQHYHEGAWAVFGKTVHPMVFLVAEKAEPYLAQPFRVHPESMEAAEARYLELCDEFASWDHAGRPARGYKFLEEVKLWL